MSGEQAPTDGQTPTDADTSPASEQPVTGDSSTGDSLPTSAGEDGSTPASDTTQLKLPIKEDTSATAAVTPTSKPMARLPSARGTGPRSRGLGWPNLHHHRSALKIWKQQAKEANKGTGGKQKKSKPRPGGRGQTTRQTASARSGHQGSDTEHASSLPDDIQAELDAELAAAVVEEMLSGSAGMANRTEPLSEGASVQGKVLKIHDDNVFIALGGPDEGVVAFEQFEQEPAIGDTVEVLVRGISREDGLYALGLPGSAIEASDWEDIEEGSVVEVTVTCSNSGGLECKVGGVKGFIPISQISEYRVEDTSNLSTRNFAVL